MANYSEPPRALVVLSGGVDSTVALYLALERFDGNVEAVSVDYGQTHSRELNYARETCARLGVPHQCLDAHGLGLLLSSSLTTSAEELPRGRYDVSNMASTVVPNRNAILVNLIGGIAVSRKAEAVVIGVHAGDHALYPDCTPQFIDAAQVLLSTANTHQVELWAPLLHKTKAEIVEDGAMLGVDFALTYSCYAGEPEHCGECGTCRERIEAFEESGVADPTPYTNWS